MFLQTFEVALNSVPNIRHCFITRFTLRDATGQSRTFSNEYAVLVWSNCDAKFHITSVAIAGAVRNANICVAAIPLEHPAHR